MRIWSLITVLVAISLLFSGCGGPSGETWDTNSPANSAPKPARSTAGAPVQASADEAALRAGLRLQIRPLVSGLPSGSDRIYFDIGSWQLGPAEVSYKVPPDISGKVAIAEETRETGLGFISPFFMGKGETQRAPGPLIWLSAQSFRELHGSGETKILPTSLSGGMPGGGTGGGEPMPLKKTGEGKYVLLIANQRREVPVIVAEDGSGTIYKVLDSADNPLVVSLQYGGKAIIGGRPIADLLPPTASGYSVHAIEPIPAQSAQTERGSPAKPDKAGNPAPAASGKRNGK